MSQNDAIIRFLKSIGINEYKDYDLEFVNFNKVVGYSDKWVFEFSKQTPWDLEQLLFFLSSLTNVDYSLRIKYSYPNQIRQNDVVKLFKDWYKKQTYLSFTGEFKLDDNINVVFSTREEYFSNAYLISDFNLLLKEINYDFKLIASTSEIIGKAEVEEIEEELDEDISEGTKKSEEIYLRNHQDIQEELKKQQMKKKSSFNRSRDYIEMDIGEIDENSGAVSFTGKIYSTGNSQTKKGYIFKFGISKGINGIRAIAFSGRSKNLSFERLSEFQVDQYVTIHGNVELDTFNHSGFQVVVTSIELAPEPELPNEQYKGELQRVELHAHTRMSTMDGVSGMKEYLRLAAHYGHKAFAITDHGGVQAYPDGVKYGKKNGVKVIYGIEMYMIDTQLQYIFNPSDIKLSEADYTVFDLETTGLSSRYDRIIEFGAVKVQHGMVTKRIDILINPGKDVLITEKISQLTNITEKMLYHKPTIEECIDEILDFIGDDILVSHNAEFDYGFLKETLKRLNRPVLNNPVIDTLNLSRYLFPESRGHRLGNLAKNMDVAYDTISAHRADYDAKVLSDVWLAMIVVLTKDNHDIKHKELNDLKISELSYKHLRPKHVIVLAKNTQGIKDIYKLVSLSNTTYLADVPKIPRSELMKNRENIILGSACFEGEVFQTALTRSEDELIDVAKFYDYLELQHAENYSFAIHLGKIADEQMLHKMMRDIYNVGKIVNRPTVATGDVHYATVEDKIYRDVFIYAKGVGGVNHPLMPYEREKYAHFENPDQHYRTTQEMLDAFSVQGLFDKQTAYEIVVKNSNLIADMIGDAKPLKEGLFTPNIPHATEELTNIVYTTAKKMYGENLPEIIKTRLEKELHGIISNGFAIIYYISYRLVKKANEDGYIVGSRGSVGSSLVATFSGITEVNPLPPHYRCPKCQHSEFGLESIAKSGIDLPEKKCPVCESLMISDGQNIPFETFLGFNAEKVPDIDLNFPGDYQSRAHDYTKVLLGENNVFRAGTIETVAEKTAFGYVRGYFERNGFDLSTVKNETIAAIAAGCLNVKRTTGQHPGGIVVIPDYMEVYDFTAIQFPADNKDSSWLTTHIDYNAIHDNVLKLDILGHVDPLALKMNCDLAGITVEDIPLGDPKALRLFSSNDVLNLTHNYLGETHGALGIPEFGTPFVRKLLIGAKPKTFNDLLIISGLSHGTGVWTGNADELIEKGVVDLSGVIGCRDDIMTSLVAWGVPNAVAFQTMESVRKGKHIPEKYLPILIENKVPQYYIESCNKISYLFPKAHATAYVTMAVRIAWFKVHRPLEYYATYFTVRSKQYDIASMVSGADAMVAKLGDIRLARKANIGTPKDDEIEKTLQIAIEMVDRGYKFSNIDIYKSYATQFRVDKENKMLIPPFNVVDGLGDNTAISVVEARENGEFISIQDLVSRTKLNTQNIDRLKELGVLDGLTESNQMSLFDF